MKSINKIATTSIKPEFESNVENVKNELRKCILKDTIDTITEKEQHDCYRRQHITIDNLNIEYVPKKLDQ